MNFFFLVNFSLRLGLCTGFVADLFRVWWCHLDPGPWLGLWPFTFDPSLSVPSTCPHVPASGSALVGQERAIMENVQGPFFLLALWSSRLSLPCSTITFFGSCFPSSHAHTKSFSGTSLMPSFSTWGYFNYSVLIMALILIAHFYQH